MNRSRAIHLVSVVANTQGIVSSVCSNILAAFSLLVPATAAAQSREPFESEPQGPLFREDVAGSRQLPGQPTLGIALGSVLVQPTATVRVAANSNVLNRSADKRGDVYVVFEPSVKAIVETGRNALVLKAEAAVARFASLGKQNSETFSVEANGRFEVARRTAIFARVSFDRRIEQRGAAGGSEIEGSPADYDQIETQIGARAEAGNMRVTASVTASKRSYAPIRQTENLNVVQSFRDAKILTVGLKAEYALPSQAILFVTANANRTNSLQPLACCDRSSSGAQVMAGVRADVSSLVTAEASLGYVLRNYDARRLREFEGLAYQAKIDWYATPLLSASVSANRSIVNSGLPTEPGIVVNTTGFQLHYELRRNLNFLFSASHGLEKYRELGVRANALTLGIDARYVLSDRLVAGAFARLRDRNSTNEDVVRPSSGFEGGAWLRFSM